VLFAAEKFDEALKLTAVKAGDSYRSAFQELAGDIYFKKGDRKLAFEAYSNARDASEEPSEDLQMKYYNLLDK